MLRGKKYQSNKEWPRLGLLKIRSKFNHSKVHNYLLVKFFVIILFNPFFFFHHVLDVEFDAPPSSLMDSLVSPKVNNGRQRSWGVLSGSQHFGGRGVCQSSGMGLGRLTSNSITQISLHKPNNKLVSAQLEHLWCMDELWANTNSQDSRRPGLGGSHHLPSCSILCAWPWDQHPNVILSRDSQVRVPKFSKFELQRLWGLITLCADFQLR